MRLALLLILVAAPLTAMAQVDPILEPFAVLLGQWEGEAWYMTENGERVSLHQTEVVEPRLSGRLLTVEGTGRALDAAGQPGPVVFNAFGLFSYDIATDTVYLDAFTADGRHIRTEPVVTDTGYEWHIDADGRLVRYVMVLDDADRWIETGEVSLDGSTTWIPFFGMTLERQSTP